MLVGLVGLLSGYDGHFEFKSGEKYPENVPYVAMRVMLATFGVGMVPLGWYTAVELGMSQWASHLVALMILFGTSMPCSPWMHEINVLSQMLAGSASLALFSLTPCSSSSHSLLFSVSRSSIINNTSTFFWIVQ